MDRDKKSGRSLAELKKIYDEFSNFGFVLDVQHAYENDPTGKLAIEAAEMMGSRLRHLHVSGQKQRPEGLSRHSFLYEADNREEILRVLAHPFLVSGCNGTESNDAKRAKGNQNPRLFFFCINSGKIK